MFENRTLFNKPYHAAERKVKGDYWPETHSTSGSLPGWYNLALATDHTAFYQEPVE